MALKIRQVILNFLLAELPEPWSLRTEAANLRVLAGGTHLTSEQGATLLREAEAADRQAEWWITGDNRPAPSMKEARS